METIKILEFIGFLAILLACCVAERFPLDWHTKQIGLPNLTVANRFDPKLSLFLESENFGVGRARA